MRQIRKQFDNLVVPRLIQDGQALAHVLPFEPLVYGGPEGGSNTRC